MRQSSDGGYSPFKSIFEIIYVSSAGWIYGKKDANQVEGECVCNWKFTGRPKSHDPFLKHLVYKVS